MYVRKITLTTLIASVLSVGVGFFAITSFTAISFSAESVGLRTAKVPPHSVASKPTSTERDGRPGHAISAVLENHKEFVIYGAIAGLGVLIMGLAIGSASANPKSKNQEQLELLKQEKEKAENLARLKAEFLNQVSHELRTPLAVIIGYIECITDGLYGKIDPKHQEILQVVVKQSSHLKNMIDQILIYSRLEAGKQPVKFEDLQLTKIIHDMEETFDFLCRQKGLEMRWNLPKDSVTISSDAVRVKEVISNLIQNAVKYTDRGSITLRLERQSSTGAVIVEVQDTGMGISEHHLASIFEPFMQAHKTSSENSRGGIGLGLSIVKKHVDQIGGTIRVESELGKGSTFKVLFPKRVEKHPSHSHRLRSWLKPFSLGRHSHDTTQQPHQMKSRAADSAGVN